jgi:midasin
LVWFTVLVLLLQHHRPTGFIRADRTGESLCSIQGTLVLTSFAIICAAANLASCQQLDHCCCVSLSCLSCCCLAHHPTAAACRSAQVEPARKVQEMAAASLQLLNMVTQQLLLAAADHHHHHRHQQQQQINVPQQAAVQLQQFWDTYSNATNANHHQGPDGLQPSHAAAAAEEEAGEEQPLAAGAAAAAAAAAAVQEQSVSDTLQQVEQLQTFLQRFKQLLSQISQQHLQLIQQQQQQQIDDLLQKCNSFIGSLSSPAGTSTAGRFEWVDGSLTRAIQQGSWVLLDNANLVNPTVLDRLNALLEPNGVLQLDEAGGVQGSAGPGGGRVVVPHPGFRLLLAYDPKHGEVSRAMRNRGVELFLLSPPPQLPQPPQPPPAAAAAAAQEAPQVCRVGAVQWWSEVVLLRAAA